jgi:hypothetical protein
MKLFTVLALALALGLSACGAAEEGSPVAATTGESEPAATPDVARVVCDEDGTRLETPSVKPQGDGIHVEVVNNTSGERSFSVTSVDGGAGMGLGAPPGTSTQIVDLGPGPLTVSCTDPAVEVEGGEALEVVDEDGIWVSTTLGCPEQFSQVLDYMAGAKGETSDPIEAARKAVEGYGLEADDVFERAGYPDAETARVRLVRNGENLAVIDLMDDGTGKWLVGMVTGCSILEG